MNYKFLFNLLKTRRNSNQIQFFTEVKVYSQIPPLSLYSKVEPLMTKETIFSVFLKYLELPHIST